MTKTLEPSVLARIHAAAQDGSNELHLKWCNLEEIPTSILELQELEELDLEGNHIQELPNLIEQLPSLKRIDLRRNPLQKIKSQPGLVLDWSIYRQHQDEIKNEHIAGLRLDESFEPATHNLKPFPSLTLLDLSPYDNQPLDPKLNSEHLFERIVNDAPNLRELHLFYSKLPQLPGLINSLRNLETLDLTGNQSKIIFKELAPLRTLKRLNLSDTGISRIPEWVCKLPELRDLNVSFNNIRSIPSQFSNLKNLQSFFAVNNNLSKLPPSFTKLSKLEWLVLSENPFTQIPSEVFELKALRRFQLNGSGSVHAVVWARGDIPVKGAKNRPGRLREIPERILKLERLEHLEALDQPIETPPLEVVKQGLGAIKDYWRQRAEAGTDYLCEAKLIVVGEPGAGKTSLANKLVNPNYELQPTEESTEGIDVLRWSFPTTLYPKNTPSTRPLSRSFHVNIWDFGGQEIYHATHQFFLTRRSVYVLVGDSRKEDTDFYYWLNVIELLSENSPVIIVKNEKQDRRRDIDEQGLRSRFSNLREVLATNLDGNRGLNDVERAIRHHLEGLPHIGEALPATWKRVKEALERDNRNYISTEEYLRVCELHGFARHSDKLQLSGYLHDLGICLHFQDDPVLKGTVILKPKWGTDAVYRVLDDPTVINQKGRFSRKNLDTIWSEATYASMHDELLQLMMRFRLCYRLEGTDTYIAPQLLTTAQPAYTWNTSGDIVLKYRYDFMPKGIVTRLIVSLHQLILDQTLVWRSGAVFERAETQCEVIEDYPHREIRVRVVGAYPRELLAIVDNELTRIHNSFQRLRYETWVPCRCSECARRPEPNFYEFDILKRFARDGKPIQCQLSYDMVDVQQLIEATLSKRHDTTEHVLDGKVDGMGPSHSAIVMSNVPSKEVFVSYAWGGESEKVVDSLEKAFTNHGFQLLRDKNELTYRSSIRTFMQRLGRGKCVVVVISKKYLESPSCMFELSEIANHKDFRDRIFPLVLPDADIFRAAGILGYIKYWEAKIKELDALMREVELTNLQGIQEEINTYRRIRSVVAEIVNVLRDTNMRTVESHLASEFRDILLEIGKKLSV